MSGLGTLIKDQLAIDVWVHFWTPWVSMSILMLIPHYLDYYIFVVTFEIAMCEFSFFVPFLGLLWLLESPEIPCEF